MPLQTTDLFIVERAGVQYKMTATQIADFVGAIRDFTVADITARNALTGLKVGDRVFVTNATGDATVTAGWAIYRASSIGPIVYAKVQEQESMDVVVTTVTNLTATVGAASVIINSDTGTDAIIPLATASLAGLASPSMFTNEHVKAVAGLTAASNPININATTQALTFGITQLTALP
jgi:hypothetical protein